MKRKLKCGCSVEGCICKHQVDVFKYVPKDAIVICTDCSGGKHIFKKQTKKTNVLYHVDMFVKNR